MVRRFNSDGAHAGQGEPFSFGSGARASAAPPSRSYGPRTGLPRCGSAKEFPSRFRRTGARHCVVFRRDPNRLALVSAGPGEEKTLPAGGVRDYAAATNLVYSTAFFPDGRRIVFVAAAQGGARRLWLQDIREGLPQPFGPAEELFNPVVSPDGSSVAACTGAEDVLVVLSTAGETRRRLHLAREQSVAPIGWFTDNRSVFLRVRNGNDTRIDLLDTASGARRVWRKLTIQDKAGILRGSFLTFISHDGRTIITSHFRLLNDLYLVKNVR